MVPVAASNLGRTNRQKDEGAFVDNLMHVHESGFIGTERERERELRHQMQCMWAYVGTQVFFFFMSIISFFSLRFFTLMPLSNYDFIKFVILLQLFNNKSARPD